MIGTEAIAINGIIEWHVLFFHYPDLRLEGV